MKKLNIDEYILKNYKVKTNAQMAQELGCSKSTISNHRKHLGISASMLNSNLREYTQYICEQYGKKTSTKLANELNCSKSFIKKLSPEIAVVTNQLGKVYPNVKWTLTMDARVPIFATYDNDGIIASITDDDEIILTNFIM